MSYLTFPLSYNYFVNFQNKQNFEFFEADNLHGTFKRRVPEFAYADYARLLNRQQILDMQSAAGFPIFILNGDHDFSQDLATHTEQYISVPIVFLTDIDPNTNYILEHNGTFDVLDHVFWNNAWQRQYGLEAHEINAAEFPLSHPNNNYGVLYFLMPYNGVTPNDPKYLKEYYVPKKHVPKLYVDVESGGGSAQRELLGEAFRAGSNEPMVETSYLKLSLVDNDDNLLGWKNAEIDARLGDVDAFARVTVFPPLNRDLNFVLRTNNMIDTSNGIGNSLTILEDYFGLEATENKQWSVLPTEASAMSENIPVTINAGTSEVRIPLTFKKPSLRECVVLEMANFDDRTDLKILNNQLAVAVRNHSASDFNINNDGIQMVVEIYNSTESIKHHSIISPNVDIVLPRGEYMVVFTLKCYNPTLYQLYKANNQPISSVEKTAERSYLFYGDSKNGDGSSNPFIQSNPHDVPMVFDVLKDEVQFKSRISLMSHDNVTFNFKNYRANFIDVVGRKLPEILFKVRV